MTRERLRLRVKPAMTERLLEIPHQVRNDWGRHGMTRGRLRFCIKCGMTKGLSFNFIDLAGTGKRKIKGKLNVG